MRLPASERQTRVYVYASRAERDLRLTSIAVNLKYMESLDQLERAAGLDPDRQDSRLRRQLAEADDELIERLVQMRKDKGLTQKVVAERMKRDVAAVSNFERLRADPHLSTIRRYAAAIGASITHGVDDADKRPVRSRNGRRDSLSSSCPRPGD